MRHLILIALVAFAFVAPVAEGQEVRVNDGWMLVGTLDSWTVEDSATRFVLGVGLIGGRVEVVVSDPITFRPGSETLFDVTLGELVHHRESLIGARVRMSGQNVEGEHVLRSLRPLPRRIVAE